MRPVTIVIPAPDAEAVREAAEAAGATVFKAFRGIIKQWLSAGSPVAGNSRLQVRLPEDLADDLSHIADEATTVTGWADAAQQMEEIAKAARIKAALRRTLAGMSDASGWSDMPEDPEEQVSELCRRNPRM